MASGRTSLLDLRRAAAALAAVALATGAPMRANALTAQRAVEPPPAEFASGPTRTGKTWELVFDDPAKVNYFCSLAMGEPSRKGGYWMGCYRPDLDAVVLMSRAAWPSVREWRELRAHEWAHARGWRHAPARATRP